MVNRLERDRLQRHRTAARLRLRALNRPFVNERWTYTTRASRSMSRHSSASHSAGRSPLAAREEHHRAVAGRELQELDGRKLERIRMDPPVQCAHCSGQPIYAYVDRSTFYPVRIESPHAYVVYPNGPVLRLDVVVRTLGYEYLPRSAANLARRSGGTVRCPQRDPRAGKTLAAVAVRLRSRYIRHMDRRRGRANRGLGCALRAGVGRS
jgi:hypothetical protein